MALFAQRTDAVAGSSLIPHPSPLDTVPVQSRGVTPPRNIRNYDTGSDRQYTSKFGQMLGVRRYSSTLGDTLVGFVPVYYLGDSVLKVGTYTVLHTGNQSTLFGGITASARFTGIGTSASPLELATTGTGAGSCTLCNLSTDQYGRVTSRASGTVNLGTQVSGTLAPTNGGTGLSSYVVGDLLFANTTTSLARLADVATGNALISGGVGVAPSWGKIGLTTHVSGTLPIANGGTGLSAIGTANQLLRINSGGTAAEWFTPSYLTSNQTITLSGAVTGSGTTSIVTTLASGIVASANIVDGTIAAGDLSALGATTAGQVLTWNGSAWSAAAATGGITGSGVSGQVSYWNGSSSQTGENALFWDAANDRLGIGTVTPSFPLTVFGGTPGVQLEVRNSVGDVSYIQITDGSSGPGATNGMTIGYNAGGLISNRENTDIIISTNDTPRWYVKNTGHILPYADGVYDIGVSGGLRPRSGFFQSSIVAPTVTGSTVVLAGDGSASTPSHSFTNDPDVGMYRPTTNQLAFATAGIERLKLGATGEVYFNAQAGSAGQLLQSNGASAAPTWVNAPTGSGVAGQVAYWTGTNTEGGSNNFTWTNASSLLTVTGNQVLSGWLARGSNYSNVMSNTDYGSTGYKVINTNIPNTAQRVLTLRILAKNDVNTIEIMVSAYANAGTFTWLAASNNSTVEIPLQIAYSPSNQVCFILGTPSFSWYYTDLIVANVISGALNVTQAEISGWTTTNTASLTGYTQVTAINYNQLYRSQSSMNHYIGSKLAIGTTSTSTADQLHVAGTMQVTGQSKLADGSAATPSISFLNDLNTGLYRPGSDIVGASANGTEVARFSPGQFSTVAGTASAPSHSFTGDGNTGLYSPGADVLGLATAGTLRLNINSDGTSQLTGTATAATHSLLTLYHAKNGTPADDDAVRLDFELKDSGGNETIFNRISAVAANVANGSEAGGLDFWNASAGTLTLNAQINNSWVRAYRPIMPGQYTAAAAGALSAANGMLIYVTNTDATFTSIGFWGRENGAWVKL